MNKSDSNRNIILIGMPGSGKSTVGVLLAKALCRDFIDTDLLIQRKTGKKLQETVDTLGYMALRSIEEETIASLDSKNAIIATGGSAVYSDRAMKKLRSFGVVVFLKASLFEIQRRIKDFSQRGLACPPKQSIKQLFSERDKLYRTYADIIIDTDRNTMEWVVKTIVMRIERYNAPAK